MDTWLPLIKAWKQKDSQKTHKLLKIKIESSFTFNTFKLFFHQKKVDTFSNSPIDGAQHWFKKKLVRLAKNGVSQECIGPLILEKMQMYILTRAESLYTLCYEIPCTRPNSTAIRYLRLNPQGKINMLG